MTIDEWQAAVLAVANACADAFAALGDMPDLAAYQRDQAAEIALLDLVTQRPAADKEQA